MPGASSVASSSGGNGGGTKRRADVLAPHVHSPGTGAVNSAHLSLNTSSVTVAATGVGVAEGETCALNGVSGGEGDGATAASSSQGTDRQRQLPSAAVMKMKAEVFEKDRDNFLNAFEKPTQIYRFLRARMMESPTFLQRNLSYMKSRMSRSHKSRDGFKLETIAQRFANAAETGKIHSSRHSLLFSPKGSAGFFHSSGPTKFYNVIVLGVTDGQMWLPETKAKVDICIARVCFNKRKEGPGPVNKIFDRCVELKIHSPSSPRSAHEITVPYAQNCPVIPIPAELCTMGTNGHTVRSYKMVVRVAIPKGNLHNMPVNNKSGDFCQNTHLNSRNSINNNNSDTNMDEPKAKRRRSVPATKDRENFVYDGESKTGITGGGNGTQEDGFVVYTGHISLYEQDIPGDRIREVDFDLQLNNVTKGFGTNKISHQRIRQEISWETFDDKHTKVLEQAKPAGKCAKVCVAIRTSSDPPPSYVDPPPPLLSAVKKEDGAPLEGLKTSLARQEIRRSVRVIYQFMYGNSSQQQTESRDDLRCPWCSLNCMQLYSLMKHLKLNHPRFQFTYSPIPNGAKVDVSINDAYDGSYSGSAFDLVSQPPGEAFARNGPTKRTEVFSILVCRPKPCKQTLQEFFECEEKDVDQRRTYITGHNRLYHHTSTCLPIHPREIDVDSEGEPDPEWLRVKTTMMIDEFTDVNEGEKELMKLWNLHVMKFNYVGDCQIPFACKRFVELHGKELIQKNLYRNFCLHLTNLFDFGLLTPQGVHTTIQLLHSQMRECTTTAALMNRDGWKPKSHAVNGCLTNYAESNVSMTFTANNPKNFTVAIGGSAGIVGNFNSFSSSNSCTLMPPTTNISPKSVPSSLVNSTITASTTEQPAITDSSTAMNNLSSAMLGTGSISSLSATSSPTSFINTITATSPLNGVHMRKLEVKDDNSPSKKQTYFWLGGSYN